MIVWSRLQRAGRAAVQILTPTRLKSPTESAPLVSCFRSWLQQAGEDRPERSFPDLNWIEARTVQQHQHDDVAFAVYVDFANSLTATRSRIVGAALNLNTLVTAFGRFAKGVVACSAGVMMVDADHLNPPPDVDCVSYRDGTPAIGDRVPLWSFRMAANAVARWQPARRVR